VLSSSIVDLDEALRSNGRSAGINHGIAQDGRVAVLTVKEY